MRDKLVVPLFVLPNGIFPTSEEPLRVFEPRYKQMLDDCILNDLPFGYIATKKPYTEIKGWSAPADFGVLAKIENFTEQGSNLLFTAKGDSRFKIKKIIPPALPAKMFEDVFPSVEELVEAYIGTNPNGKLYLRAEIEILAELKGDIEVKRWEEFIGHWSEYIIKMNLILRGELIIMDELDPLIKNEFCPYSESKLWSACQSILDTNDMRQLALAAFEAEEIILLLKKSLKEKDAQIEFISNIINKEEE